MTRDYLFPLVFNPVRVAANGQNRRKVTRLETGARHKERYGNETPLCTCQHCP